MINAGKTPTEGMANAQSPTVTQLIQCNSFKDRTLYERILYQFIKKKRNDKNTLIIKQYTKTDMDILYWLPFQ
jgi:hypothetical protein